VINGKTSSSATSDVANKYLLPKKGNVKTVHARFNYFSYHRKDATQQTGALPLNSKLHLI